MYEEFYGMAHTPFTRGIPSEFLYMSSELTEVQNRLEYVAQRQLFAVLTGDCGTGKTTILRRFRDGLDPNRYKFLYLSDSKLTPRNFYRALLALPRYRDDGHMFTWLCTIGKNLWLNECRRQRRLEPLEGQEGAADGPEAEALRHDTRRALRRAVLELPEEYRDVVILHVYGGVPLRELAERRGKSESWGKVTFYRAKALLREKLEGWT